ncbi:MAG TPA: PIN domain-containing protein [Acetobacteraceae bacterium]|nr:PIN domain-containing protein [Acetobacteraceae bacterium]
MSGLAVMPEGRSRSALETTARAMFTDGFGGRVLPFDTAAAEAYAAIFAGRRRAGRPVAPLDLMIAAIARARGAGVVTRDIDGFEDCGVPLIDPWQVQTP